MGFINKYISNCVDWNRVGQCLIEKVHVDGYSEIEKLIAREIMAIVKTNHPKNYKNVLKSNADKIDQITATLSSRYYKILLSKVYSLCKAGALHK